MLKDRFLRRFYFVLIITFLVIYYEGNERDRNLEKSGFKLCEINGVETWSNTCPEEESFIKELGVIVK